MPNLKLNGNESSPPQGAGLPRSRRRTGYYHAVSTGQTYGLEGGPYIPAASDGGLRSFCHVNKEATRTSPKTNENGGDRLGAATGSRQKKSELPRLHT